MLKACNNQCFACNKKAKPDHQKKTSAHLKRRMSAYSVILSLVFSWKRVLSPPNRIRGCTIRVFFKWAPPRLFFVLYFDADGDLDARLHTPLVSLSRSLGVYRTGGDSVQGSIAPLSGRRRVLYKIEEWNCVTGTNPLDSRGTWESARRPPTDRLTHCSPRSAPMTDR